MRATWSLLAELEPGVSLSLPDIDKVTSRTVHRGAWAHGGQQAEGDSPRLRWSTCGCHSALHGMNVDRGLADLDGANGEDNGVSNRPCADSDHLECNVD